MNDFAGLYISYYMVHSLELIIIGFMLFIGSVACISIYNLINLSRRVSYGLILDFLTFFSKLYDRLFLRNQNMIKQSFTKDTIRYCSRKVDRDQPVSSTEDYPQYPGVSKGIKLIKLPHLENNMTF